MSRDQAVQKLQGKSVGTFLIRRSPRNSPDDYVLSVAETEKIANYIIYKDKEHDQYKIGDQIFNDMAQLLEHYRVNYLDTTTLTSPVQKVEIPKKKESQKQNSLGYVKAKFDFQGQDEEDLPFKKGDILEIVKKQEDKWWTARNNNGRTGSIPVPYVEITSSKNHDRPNSMPEVSPNNSRPPSGANDPNRTVFAKVIMRRVPNVYDPEALPLEIGEIIKVTRMNVNGQWEGMIGDRKGHFPFTHVKIVDPNSMNQ